MVKVTFQKKFPNLFPYQVGWNRRQSLLGDDGVATSVVDEPLDLAPPYSSFDLSWSDPSPAQDDLILAPHEVHIWRANLDLTPEKIEALLATLSPPEQERANRFHFSDDRRHFIAARGILRNILARYLGMGPEKLHFGYSDRGKPYLETTSAGGMVQFNVSHSQGTALYAVTLGSDIGIDLEAIRPVDYHNLAQRFFSPTEAATLAQLPPESQQTAFFRAWTCKEAYLKATGAGISGGLAAVEISIHPENPPQLLSIGGNPYLTERWSLKELKPGPGFTAAVAVEGPIWSLNTFVVGLQPSEKSL